MSASQQSKLIRLAPYSSAELALTRLRGCQARSRHQGQAWHGYKGPPPASYHLLQVPATYYLLPTTYYLLPTTYYLLPTTYHLLPTTYYLLPTTYFLLPTTYYLLPTTCLLRETLQVPNYGTLLHSRHFLLRHQCYPHPFIPSCPHDALMSTTRTVKSGYINEFLLPQQPRGSVYARSSPRESQHSPRQYHQRLAATSASGSRLPAQVMHDSDANARTPQRRGLRLQFGHHSCARQTTISSHYTHPNTQDCS